MIMFAQTHTQIHQNGSTVEIQRNNNNNSSGGTNEWPHK